MTPFSTRADTCLTQPLNHLQHQPLLVACWLNGKRSFLVVPEYIPVCRLCQISFKESDSILSLLHSKTCSSSLLPPTWSPYSILPKRSLSFHSPFQLGLPLLGLPTPHLFQPPDICLPNTNFPLSVPKCFPSFKACPKIQSSQKLSLIPPAPQS